mgnify:CR=1 FL=1
MTCLCLFDLDETLLPLDSDHAWGEFVIRLGWVDEAEFHPSWHELLGKSVEFELHSSPWKHPRPGAHAARGAAFMCMSQAEAGIGCPISMTYSVIPALRTQPELIQSWQQTGRKVHCWTANAADDVTACVQARVDAIITDLPAQTLALVRSAAG